MKSPALKIFVGYLLLSFAIGALSFFGEPDAASFLIYSGLVALLLSFLLLIAGVISPEEIDMSNVTEEVSTVLLFLLLLFIGHLSIGRRPPLPKSIFFRSAAALFVAGLLVGFSGLYLAYL